MPTREDDARRDKLIRQAHKLMEGQKLGDVMMACIAVLLNAIKQAPKAERQQIGPFLERFWQKLSKEIADA